MATINPRSPPPFSFHILGCSSHDRWSRGRGSATSCLDLDCFHPYEASRKRRANSWVRESRTLVKRRHTIKRQRPRTICDANVHKRRQPLTCNHFSADYPRCVFDRTSAIPRAARSQMSSRSLVSAMRSMGLDRGNQHPRTPHTMPHRLRTWERAVCAGIGRLSYHQQTRGLHVTSFQSHW